MHIKSIETGGFYLWVAFSFVIVILRYCEYEKSEQFRTAMEFKSIRKCVKNRRTDFYVIRFFTKRFIIFNFNNEPSG